ncbi:hypothetical protein J437_LFUL004688 [Ladona fulva]|uniref:C2H2-type domain-containing protein n=1 Tax=Ladona fulva TaxID=123851 RepID=A0A8K0PCY5_LADFU|nr:hypothetical protein J437_LFUL004688 [Ladona fulva]
MEVTPHHHPQHPPPLAAMDCYEDMFKEITRKLYGEEGLPENAQGPEAGGATDTGMRMMDYGEGGGGGGGGGGGDAGSGALSAFGLALMHNGFQSPADMKFRAPVHPAHLNHHHLNHHLNHHHLANHHHHINHLANHHAHPLIHHAPQQPPPPPQQPSPAVPTSSAPSASTPTTLGNTTPTASSTTNLPPSADDKWITSDDSLPWTTSKIASYNPAQKLFKCSECDCVGFLSRVAEHWLGTHANLRVFQCPQCPYASAWARCVRMHLTRQHSGGEGGGGATTPNGTPQPPESPQPYGADGNSSSSSASPSPWKENPVLEEVTKFLQALRCRVEEKGDGGGGGAAPTFPTAGSTTPRNGGGGGSGEPGTATSTPTTGGAGSGGGKGGGRRGGTNSSSGGTGNSSGGEKRYCCPACPYATDRRDLFTRHENIHRDEKPFQCYVCAKQFNRADHVKKHFLRMHRDHPYDLNKIRRSPPKNASGMSFYHKYNGGTAATTEGGGAGGGGGGGGGTGAPESSGNTTPVATNGNASNSRNVLQQPSHLQTPSLIPAPLAASLMHTNHHNHLGGSPQNHQHLGIHPTTGTNNYQVSGPGKMANTTGTKRNQQNGMKGGVLGGTDPVTGKPKKPKKVGDKRYSCCYCAWSGADNWCLKRHLNTHIKPFLCPLCDYKAARSERLATHVLKVHNKRACAKCAFLGDDQLALSEHVQEHHPTEIKNANRSNNTLLRNVTFPCYQPPMSTSFW